MNIKSLSHKSADFPKTLLNIDPPVKSLYYRGSISHSKPRVSIIGTRRPTTYGQHVTEKIVTELAKHDVCIISGLAIGIDGLAHKHALEGNATTWAVLPASLSKIYPTRHSQMAQQILASGGALISEHPDQLRPNGGSFIARNRIIAGLCDLLIVVEASHKSGTMHTVNFALQMGIEVAAVPGPITSVLSDGTNSILKDGGQVISSPQTVLDILGLEAAPRQARLSLSPDQKQICSHLQKGACGFGELVKSTGFENSKLMVALSQLELNGAVKRHEDGLYGLS